MTAFELYKSRRIAELLRGAPPLQAPLTPTPRPRPSPTRRDTGEDLYGICVECGRSHEPANRRRLIRPMVGSLAPAEIRALWPCFYPPGSANDGVMTRLNRDIAAVRSAG